MIKNISKLEHKIGERVYTFLCEMDSPLSEVKETLFEFIKHIGQVEDNIKNHLESLKNSEPQVTPTVAEEATEEPKPME